MSKKKTRRSPEQVDADLIALIGKGLSGKEIAAKTHGAIYKYLNRLVEQGLIERTGTRNGFFYQPVQAKPEETPQTQKRKPRVKRDKAGELRLKTAFAAQISRDSVVSVDQVIDAYEGVLSAIEHKNSIIQKLRGK